MLKPTGLEPRPDNPYPFLTTEWLVTDCAIEIVDCILCWEAASEDDRPEQIEALRLYLDEFTKLTGWPGIRVIDFLQRNTGTPAEAAIALSVLAAPTS